MNREFHNFSRNKFSLRRIIIKLLLLKNDIYDNPDRTDLFFFRKNCRAQMCRTPPERNV
jgi:hypothetical protein